MKIQLTPGSNPVYGVVNPDGRTIEVRGLKPRYRLNISEDSYENPTKIVGRFRIYAWSGKKQTMVDVLTMEPNNGVYMHERTHNMETPEGAIAAALSHYEKRAKDAASDLKNKKAVLRAVRRLCAKARKQLVKDEAIGELSEKIR